MGGLTPKTPANEHLIVGLGPQNSINPFLALKENDMRFIRLIFGQHK